MSVLSAGVVGSSSPPPVDPFDWRIARELWPERLSAEPQHRWPAFDELAPGTVGRLAELTSHPNAGVRLAALRRLRRLGPEALLEASPELRAALRDRSAAVRTSAASAIGRAGPQLTRQCWGDLWAMSSRGDTHEAGIALSVLREAGQDDLRAIESAASHDDAVTRCHAITLLGWMPHATGRAELVIRGSRDADLAVALEAVSLMPYACGDGRRACNERLLALIEDDDERLPLRALAAERAGAFRDPKALRRLAAATSSPHESIRRGAARALATHWYHARESPEELARYVDLDAGLTTDLDDCIASARLQLDGDVGRAHDLLRTAATSAHSRSSWAALEVILRSPNAPMPEASVLLSCLEESSWGISNKARELLQQRGPPPPEVLQAIIEGLGSEPDSRKWWTSEGIVACGPAAIPHLADRARNETGASRAIAVSLLGKLGPEALPVLVELIGEFGPDERHGGVRAIEALGADGAPVVESLLHLAETREGGRGLAASLGRVGEQGLPVLEALLVETGDEGRPPKPGPDADREALTEWRRAGRTRDQLRSGAAVALAKAGPAGVRALLEASRSEEAVLRGRAVHGLGVAVSSDPAAAESMARLAELALQDPDVWVRKGAVRACRGACDRAVPTLRLALADEDPGVVRDALEVLGRLGDAGEAAVPDIVGLLESPDPQTASAALRCLSRLKSNASVQLPALLAMTCGEDSVRARQAIGILAGFGPDLAEAVPCLISALESPDESLQLAAAGALGQVGPAAADSIDSLIAATRSPQPNLARVAVTALGRIDTGSARVVAAMAEILRGTDDRLRAPAITALAGLGDSGLSVLLEVFESDCGRASRQVATTLRRAALPDASLPRLRQLALASPCPTVRALATELLGLLGERELNTVEAALRDRDAEVRVEAATSLALAGRPVIEPLLSIRGDADPRLRAAALDGIVQVSLREGDAAIDLTDVLRTGCRDADAEVRYAALRALTSLPIEAPHHRDVIEELTRDDDAAIRRLAEQLHLELSDQEP